MWILVGFIILVSVVFWILQFWSVLLMRDEDFPGKNDKIMWALIVFFGSAVGAILFAIWRWEHEHNRQSERNLRNAMRNVSDQEIGRDKP